jgi:hypothetical protein
MQCPENHRLMDTLDSGHANGFIGLKGVYKLVYLSMSEKLPCFKFVDVRENASIEAAQNNPVAAIGSNARVSVWLKSRCFTVRGSYRMN